LSQSPNWGRAGVLALAGFLAVGMADSWGS